jgi:hypothetical protein
VATTSTLGRPSLTWHVRGTWTAREDRLPSAVWLGWIWLGILAGFGVDMPRFLHEAPPAPKIIYLHGAIFTGWLLLLTAQVLLVVGDRVSLHRKLGWLSVVWLPLMAVLGPWAAFASQTVAIPGPNYDPSFLSIQLGDIAGFLILVVWGLMLRKNPAAHKRIMILSTIALLDAGYGRFSGWVLPTPPKSLLLWYAWEYYGNMLLLALMASWDWWRGRLMKQFAYGAVFVIAWEFLQDFLYHWGPWNAFTTGLIAAWMRHFG